MLKGSGRFMARPCINMNKIYIIMHKLFGEDALAVCVMWVILLVMVGALLLVDAPW